MNYFLAHVFALLSFARGVLARGSFAKRTLKHLAGVVLALVLVCALPAVALAEETDSSVDAAQKVDAAQNYVDERQIPDGSFLYDTSIEALAGADGYYDGARVVVTGEVVGDRLNAEAGSNHSWITLYSLRKGTAEVYNPSSIQVYVSNSLAETIDTYGRYNVRGTRVQVSGTFNLACVDHEGLSDIHADSLQVVQKGSKVSSSFDLLSFLPGVIAVALGLLLMLVYRRMMERTR